MSEQTITVRSAKGDVVDRGPIVRLGTHVSGVDLTIRNVEPAAILWFRTFTNGPSTWQCMTRGWAKYKHLTIGVE